jgi:ABC-2 type transport system ATP-binding protein
MPIIEEFCQDILILNKGDTVLTGNLNDIKNTYARNNVVLNVNADIESFLSEDIRILSKNGTNYLLEISSEDSANSLLKNLLNNNIYVEKFEIKAPSLEDIFVEKVGYKEEEQI